MFVASEMQALFSLKVELTSSIYYGIVCVCFEVLVNTRARLLGVSSLRNSESDIRFFHQ